MLTAAHCVAGLEPYEFEVLSGSNTLSSPSAELLPIAAIFVHPDYDPTTAQNDVAILRLAQPTMIDPVAIATGADTGLYTPGTDAQVVGWGQINPSFPILPDALQKGAVKMIDDLLCSSANGRWVDLSTMVCAGDLSTSPSQIDGVDSCYGDSGGPLLVDDGGTPKQVGIISWGFACASPTFYGVYSRVSALAEWINSPHIVAPVVESRTTVSGTVAIGQTLTCEPGTYSGDPIDSTTYAWYRTEADGFSSSLIPDQESPTYVIQQADAGKQLFCEEIVSNAGGTTFNESTVTDEVPVPATPTPTPTPTATPTPTPTPDKVAPTTSVIGQLCSKTSCTISLDSRDAPSTGSVARVSVTLTGKIKRPCKKGSKVCTTKVNTTVEAVGTAAPVWSFVVERQKSAQRLKASIVATDAAGNVAPPLVIELRIPAKGDN